MDAIIHAYNPERNDQRFFIIDTEEGFSFWRFEDIIRRRELNGEILHRVICEKVYSFRSQHEVVISRLPQLMKEMRYEPSLIAIDSFVSRCYGTLRLLGPKYSKKAQERLGMQINTLFEIAQRYDCPITLTSWPNTTLSFLFQKKELKTEISEMDLIQYYLHGITINSSLLGVVIRTTKILPGVIAATLLRHAEKPTNYYTCFTITDVGISDVEDEEMRKVKPVACLHELEEKLIMDTLLEEEL
jgi:hypothetical protein